MQDKRSKKFKEDETGQSSSQGREKCASRDLTLDKMNDDCLSMIFQFLSLKDRMNLKMVNKRLCAFTDTMKAWDDCLVHFPIFLSETDIRKGLHTIQKVLKISYVSMHSYNSKQIIDLLLVLHKDYVKSMKLLAPDKEILCKIANFYKLETLEVRFSVISTKEVWDDFPKQSAMLKTVEVHGYIPCCFEGFLLHFKNSLQVVIFHLTTSNYACCIRRCMKSMPHVTYYVIADTNQSTLAAQFDFRDLVSTNAGVNLFYFNF